MKLLMFVLLLLGNITSFSQNINFDFENGLNNWHKTGNAFDNQPTFGNNVNTIRIRPEISDSIGGDYWIGTKHPIGHHGDWWIGTFENHNINIQNIENLNNDTQGDSPVGTLTSDEFIINTDFMYFLIGGNGGKVELYIKYETSATFIQNTDDLEGYKLVETKYPNDIEILSRVFFDLSEYKNKIAKLKIIDNSQYSHISVDDFIFCTKEEIEHFQLCEYKFRSSYADNTANYHKLEYFTVRDTSNIPIWGFIDTHAHWMNNVGFGGKMLHGSPYGLIDTALNNCDEHHSTGELGIDKYLLLNSYDSRPGENGHKKTGYPLFEGWPHFTSKMHQSMYIDWVKRAYYGGLRLMVCMLGNNQTLAKALGNVTGFDDLKAINIEYNQLKKLIKANKEWLEIALKPEDVKRINLENKLAIVVGMEIDKPYNWSSPDSCTTEQVNNYINMIYDKYEVRQYFPIHIANNAFGGFSLYNTEIFCINNAELHLNYPDDQKYVRIKGNSLVDFRLGEEMRFFKDYSFLIPANINRYAPPGSIFIGKVIFTGRSNYSKIAYGLGHINSDSLTSRGIDILNALMKKGMIIDIDHMGLQTNNNVLDFATSHDYPLIAGHTNFLEQMLRKNETTDNEICRMKIRNEHAKTDETLFRIKNLGGMVSPITEGDKDVKSIQNTNVENNNPGSTKTWAQTYLYALEKIGIQSIGIGTDFNGFATEISPRFGNNSAYSLINDIVRQNNIGTRDSLANIQENGVKYDSNLKDLREIKFQEGSIYNDKEIEILRGVFAAFAFNLYELENEDLNINMNIRRIAIEIELALENKQYERFSNILSSDEYIQAAAYIIILNKFHNIDIDKTIKKYFDKLNYYFLEKKIHTFNKMYQMWVNIHGNNIPLRRYKIKGTNVEYDFNIDGLAHYGLLPDFMQDLKNIGLNDYQLTPLFNSVSSYMKMWEKCVMNSRK